MAVDHGRGIVVSDSTDADEDTPLLGNMPTGADKPQLSFYLNVDSGSYEWKIVDDQGNIHGDNQGGWPDGDPVAEIPAEGPYGHVLDHLAPGAYSLVVTDPDNDDFKRKIDVNVIRLDLQMQDLAEETGVEEGEDHEINPGAFVVVNDNDNAGGEEEWLGNGTADMEESKFNSDDPDLQGLYVRTENLPATGQVVLNIPDHVELWTDRSKSSKYSRRQWDLSISEDRESLNNLCSDGIEPSVYVEATEKGDLGKISLQLEPSSNAVYNDRVQLTGIRIKISDILDKNEESVQGDVFDLKTGITEEKPARIKYEIVGTDHNFTVKEATLSARYDTEDEAHVAFYGAPTDTHENLYGPPVENQIVFQGSHTEPSADKTGRYSFAWDGRDNKKGADHRLLLGGEYRLRMGLKLEQLGDVICHSKFSGQKVAEPHAGHYCSDWPRASAYEISEIDPECVAPDNTNTYTNDVRPTLKMAHYDQEDGNNDSDQEGVGWWWMDIAFHYQEKDDEGGNVDRWLPYTSSFKTNKFEGDCKLRVDNICRTSENSDGDGSDCPMANPNSYPTARRAIIARYDKSVGKWRMYNDPYHFQDTNVDTAEPYDRNMDEGVDEPVYLERGGSCKLSYKATKYAQNEDGDYVMRGDLKVTLAEAPSSPPDGAEVAFFLLPAVDGLSGTYNDSCNSSGFVKVDMSAGGSDPTGNQDVTMTCFRGYDGRNFWNTKVCERDDDTPVYAGIHHSVSALDNSGFQMHAHRNMARSAAMDNFSGRDGLIEIQAHSNKGFLGWYEADETDEPFDPEKRGKIYGDQLGTLDLDDVSLFVAFGCYTAEQPDFGVSVPSGVTDAGADVVMAWSETQSTGGMLFLKHFFKKARTPVEAGGYKCGRTLWQAVEDAEIVAVQDDNLSPKRWDHVVKNLGWYGKHWVPDRTSLWPARYGRDDSK